MKFLFALSFVFATGLAQATPNADGLEKVCGESQSPVPYTYCVSKTPGSQSRDVLYALHGGGGNSDSWGRNPLRQIWEREHFDAPTVIEVSFGRFWILTPALGTQESGLLEALTEKIMPELEARYLAQPIGARKLYGFSMGGSNSAMLSIFKPELFKTVVLRSPAIPGISPHATEAEFEAYSKRSGISVDSIKGLSAFLTDLLPSNEAYEMYAPLPAGARLLGPQTPRMYISLGKKDQAYYFGGQEFAHLAKTKGVNLTVEVLENGDHFGVNPEAIAKFLMQ